MSDRVALVADPDAILARGRVPALGDDPRPVPDLFIIYGSAGVALPDVVDQLRICVVKGCLTGDIDPVPEWLPAKLD